jgi:hypothetical protein
MISSDCRFDEDPPELLDDEEIEDDDDWTAPALDRVVSLLPRLSQRRSQLEDGA